MSNKLKDVTFQTLKHFKTKDIVLPGEYSNVFEKLAVNSGLDIGDQNIILNDLHEDSTKLDKIVKETSNNISLLGESAQSVQIAIVNNDAGSIDTIKNDLVEMQKKLDFLQNELFTDSLTKAKNRKWFSDYYLKDDLFPSNGALAFIDLNDFKFINDNYGHIIGDLVLRYLSSFLQKHLEMDNKNVVRYAGDEFLVVFDNLDSSIDYDKKMKDVQEKLSKQKLQPKNKKDISFSFSFSYGLVEFSNTDCFSDVIEIADERMYENKKWVKEQKK
jgi:diguanylate cyclase (GGDEF)-like protein